ncbi:MAG: N-acetyl-gamma-glutamyl-phosphate reductase [Acidobacteria bacterium]|nr:N-acetyl-gamma-glutamyl-phosphate reductase [Acidobacteriota bacterium]
MQRVGVVGASGYSGAELLRLLAAHPEMEVAAATSREFAGRRIADVYPNLAVYGDMVYSELEGTGLGDLDVAFLALPHGESMALGARMAEGGARVVDFSADFRLRDPDAYPEWFGAPHAAPEWLGKWVYGLPEIHRDEIRGAALVANPGCYPTAALLALAPLVAGRLIDPATIVISAASGVSGAGRSPGAALHFAHVEGNLRAYGVPTHKHTPEIEQELSRLAAGAAAPEGAGAGAQGVTVTFVPHLVPMARGLLATCIADLSGGAPADLAALARAFWDGEPFVRVVDGLPETKYATASNLCLLGYAVDRRARRAIAVAAIDNLGKGAAGQALQNANLMLGLPETTGLGGAGVYP